MAEIKHVESSVKVFFTSDYSIFNNITGNRLLNGSKINRIIKDIQNGLDMLKYCPIIVDKNMCVIDGQHRLHVARKTKSTVWYVISEKLTLPQIAKINSNTERWKTKDFIQCYVTQKNPDYITLQEFIDKYKFSPSVCMNLLYGGRQHEGGIANLKSLYENGDFKVNQLPWAMNVAEMVLKFKDFEHYRDRSFIIAISKLMDGKKCDFDHLLRKLKEAPDLLKKCGSCKSYLKDLEELYNFKLRKREIIFS